MCPVVSNYILSLIFFLFMYIYCLKWTLRKFFISNCLCLSGFGRVASQTALVHHDDPRENSCINLQLVYYVLNFFKSFVFWLKKKSRFYEKSQLIKKKLRELNTYRIKILSRHSLDNRHRNIVPRALQYCSVYLCSARLQEMRTEKTTSDVNSRDGRYF